MVSTSEAENLLERAIGGEPGALERLLLAEAAELQRRIEARIPAGMRATVTAEDILQEAFADAFRGIASFRPASERAFAAWLASIADHRLLDAVRTWRAAKRGGGRPPARIDRSSVAALVEVLAIDERTPSAGARGRESLGAVEAALMGLRPEYRDALTLRYLRGLSAADTASRLGRTETAVNKMCSRGLQRMREALRASSASWPMR